MVRIQRRDLPELLKNIVLTSDSATIETDIPDDRKFYYVEYQIRGTQTNIFSRIQLNSISSSDYSYETHKTEGTSYANNYSHTTAATQFNPGGSSTANITISGTLNIKKVAGLDALSAEITGHGVTDESSAVSAVINMHMFGKVETADNLNHISMFFNNGNVATGSYIQVYGSRERL